MKSFHTKKPKLQSYIATTKTGINLKFFYDGRMEWLTQHFKYYK